MINFENMTKSIQNKIEELNSLNSQLIVNYTTWINDNL